MINKIYKIRDDKNIIVRDDMNNIIDNKKIKNNK